MSQTELAIEVSKRLVDDCGLNTLAVISIPGHYWQAMMCHGFVLIHVEGKGVSIQPPETPITVIRELL